MTAFGAFGLVCAAGLSLVAPRGQEILPEGDGLGVGGGVLEVLPQGGAAAGDAAAASPGAVSGRGTFQTSR